MLKKLKLKFSFQFKGIIWNMISDEDANLLVLEIRDVTLHKVQFAVVDLIEGKLILNELEFDEQWWIGMGAAKDGNFLFYIYENDQNPVPSSYFLYSLKTKSIIWEASEFTFLNMSDEGLIGLIGEEDERKQVLIHLNSGKAENIEEDYIKKLKKTANLSKIGNNSILSPFHYPEDTDYFLLVKNYLVQDHDVNVVKAIDYLETGNAIIISYYLYHEDSQHDNKKIDNYILVLNKDGKELLKEKIDETLSGIGLGIFFVIKNQLIYLKNKSEIKSYQLTNYE